MPLDRAVKRAEEHADEKKHVVRLKDAKGKVSFVDGVEREKEKKERDRKWNLETATRIAAEKGASVSAVDERSLRLLFQEANREPECSACKISLKGNAGFGLRRNGTVTIACSEWCLLRLVGNLQWVARSGGDSG
jgi:hypothetical protein